MPATSDPNEYAQMPTAHLGGAFAPRMPPTHWLNKNSFELMSAHKMFS